MKTIIGITITALMPTLAYLGFSFPNEGMLNIAHTMAWIFSSLALFFLFTMSSKDVRRSLSKKPINKIARFFNLASYLFASIIFVFFGSIATGIATMFCVFVGFVIAHHIKK